MCGLRKPISRRAVVAGAAAALTAGRSEAEDMVATLSMPAVLRLGAVPPLPPGARRRLELTLESFTPPPSGAVSAVVSLLHGGARTEIGRFTVYPATAFEAHSETEAQRFEFDVTSVMPLAGGGAWRVEIRLEPMRKDRSLTGARMRFGEARLTVQSNG
jgi:hypothetical protein